LTRLLLVHSSSISIPLYTHLPTASWKARPPTLVNKKGGRPMSNNPIFGSLRMRSDQPQSGKHVCIFELERKDALLTAEVVCTVCGVYLSSQQNWPPRTRQGRTGT
jgi:hypothetical protein